MRRLTLAATIAWILESVLVFADRPRAFGTEEFVEGRFKQSATLQLAIRRLWPEGAAARHIEFLQVLSEEVLVEAGYGECADSDLEAVQGNSPGIEGSAIRAPVTHSTRRL